MMQTNILVKYVQSNLSSTCKSDNVSVQNKEHGFDIFEMRTRAELLAI